MKKLKTKVWLNAKIKIENIVEQYKEKLGIKNKTIGFIITINIGNSILSFREDNPKKVWERIKEEIYLTKG